MSRRCRAAGGRDRVRENVARCARRRAGVVRSDARIEARSSPMAAMRR